MKAIFKTAMKHVWQVWLAATLALAVCPPAGAGAAAGALTVGPDIISKSVTPGSYNGQLLTVSSGSPVTITVRGLGQTPAGSIMQLPPQEDTSTFTARPWVSLSATQLPAGADQTVGITINVPAGIQPGQRYAAILVQGQEAAVLVPVLLTVSPSSFAANPGGSISNLSVPTVYQGKPLHALTSFSNTGNCLITKAQITTTVKGSGGVVAWQNTALVTEPSILPGYPRVIDTIDQPGLNAGSYSVTSNIALATGQVYETTTAFTVLPPIPPPAAPTLTAVGSSSVPGPLVTTFTPALQWSAVANAQYYQLSISTAPYGAADVIYNRELLTGTSFALPSGVIWGATEYSWSLIATNVYGSSNASTNYFHTYGTPIRVSTLAATNVSPTGATLNANLASLGTDTSVSLDFEYGLTPSFGSNSTSQTRNAAGQVSIPITGLTPNATYHYRVHARGASDAWGGDLTFSTPSQTPVIGNVSPASAKKGDIVTVTGSNFVAGTTVAFNGIHSPNVSIGSTTSLTAAVPDLGTANIANVSIAVSNSGGTATSVSFNYLGSVQSPTITDIAPSFGGTGDMVTITGANFVSGATVSFNSVPSPNVSVNGATTLTATVPDLGSGSINNIAVTVTTGGGSVTRTGFTYTVTVASPAAPPPPPAGAPAQGQTSTPPVNPAPAPTPPASTAPKTYHLPGINDSGLVVKSFAAGQRPYVNAIDSLGMEIEVLNASGVGTLVIGRYATEPQNVVSMSAGPLKNGLGKTSVISLGALVDGYKRNTVRVTVHYTAGEIAGLDPNSLVLGWAYDGKWRKCDKIVISAGEQTVSGEIAVSRLAEASVIGLGGTPLKDASSGVAAARKSGSKSDGGASPAAMMGIVMGTAVVIGGIVVALGMRRRRGMANG